MLERSFVLITSSSLFERIQSFISSIGTLQQEVTNSIKDIELHNNSVAVYFETNGKLNPLVFV